MKHILLLSTLLFLFTACISIRGEDEPTVTVYSRENVEAVIPTLPATSQPSVPTAEAQSATELPPTKVSGKESVKAEPRTWPPPIQPLSAFTGQLPTSEQQAVSAELSQALPPVRDDVVLAIAFRGLESAPSTDVPLVERPLPAGTRQTFNILDVVHKTISQIEAELKMVSDHAYFWFDIGPGTFEPDAGELAKTAELFDSICEQDAYFFGSENNPGVDGDPRLHIVHASPIALCGVTLDRLNNCGLAGLVNSMDTLPKEVDERSNEREMFVMNIYQFGTDFYSGVLAHEFRHMIEDNYDSAETDWGKEGSATLAAQLLGLQSGGIQRGNQFLGMPDQQLNSWAEEGTAPYYGMGYLLNRFLFDQLGEDGYRQYATHSLPGLLAVDAVAAANNLDVTGEGLWLDWLAALAILDDPGRSERYKFDSDGLQLPMSTAVTTLPTPFDTTVHQYAVDYYTLPESGLITIDFTGSTMVPLIDALPPSGQFMWVAQRANFSNPRLTRTVDLQNVSSATLAYSAYVDIELGYDFAYLSVSTDNGRTWQALETENMQGLEEIHNPSGAALTERFYTGRLHEWIDESVDLSAYAGQVIQLRFEYVTDAVITYSGLALDNLAIPEIGFYDGAETLEANWQVEGFTRTTAYLPQSWHLQLITYESGVPNVQTIPVNDRQKATISVDGGREGGKRPLLIVAATAPQTLELAHYSLEIGD